MPRLYAFVALFAFACSSSEESGPGGSSGSSGSAGAGGSAGSGGSSGSSGTSAGSSGSSGASGSSGSGGGAGVSGAAGSGGAGDTWESYAKGFFSTYCTSCHGAGSPSRDYTTLANVTRDKDEIRCGVGTTVYPGCAARPRQFPIGTGPKPSDQERQRLVAWIEAGAL